MLWPHDKQDKKRKIQDGETVLVYTVQYIVYSVYTIYPYISFSSFPVPYRFRERRNLLKYNQSHKKHNFSTLRCRKNWETYQIYPWTQCTFFTVWSITVNGLQFSITVNGFAFFPFIVKHLQEKHDNHCFKALCVFFYKSLLRKSFRKKFRTVHISQI